MNIEDVTIGRELARHVDDIAYTISQIQTARRPAKDTQVFGLPWRI